MPWNCTLWYFTISGFTLMHTSTDVLVIDQEQEKCEYKGLTVYNFEQVKTKFTCDYSIKQSTKKLIVIKNK